MNCLKKSAVLLLTGFVPLVSRAQTLIIDPHAEGGFELGSSFAANGWTVVNNASTNTGSNWYLSNNTLNSGGFSFAPTGSRVAYISNSNNGSWAYNINQYSTTHIYRDVNFPPGQDIIKLKLRWNAYGEGPTYDVLYIYSCPTTLTPVVGQPTGTGSGTGAWSGAGAAQLHGTLHTSSLMSGTTTEFTLPANFAGTNRRLVFTWKNGSTLGFQPPAAIDSIWLFSDCPKPEIQVSNNSALCSNNISINANVISGTGSGTLQWYINNVLVAGATGTTFTSNSIASGSTIRCIYSANNVCGYKDTADIVVQYNTHNYQTETLNLCSRNLPHNWRGIIIPQGAQSNSNYTTITVPQPGGCDSVITLDLQLSPSPPAKTEQLSVCRGQLNTVQWRGKTIPDNAHSSPFFDSVFVSSPNGCDSIIYLSLNIIEAGEINTQTIESCEPVRFAGTLHETTTTLHDTLRTTSGCDSAVNITKIIIEPFVLELELKHPSGSYIEGQSLTLEAKSNRLHFEILGWYPQELFTGQFAGIQTISAPAEQEVFVVGQSFLGCVDTAHLNLKAIVVDNEFEMPNAFTPNGDGKNDYFAPVFRQPLHSGIVLFQIYNRWGQQVYSDYSGSTSKGWDGYFHGKPADNGIYYYRISVKFADNSRATKSGELHLIR